MNFAGSHGCFAAINDHVSGTAGKFAFRRRRLSSNGWQPGISCGDADGGIEIIVGYGLIAHF